MRAWVVTAAVLAFLHAGVSLLGAVGMGLTADNAEPMSTSEALGVAGAVALMAVATGVCAILALTGRPRPLLAAAVVSLVISAYVAFRVASNPGGYQLPLIFAVLPVAVLVALVVGFTRRPVPA
ncbi:hypothetical protein [Pseudonocardia endophytica]|uniref:Integral membrane protein n=1 Tax=Pseudonocardia endophytica TaxID=401976 RepID=A0A4R1HH97_PSEEN|nr:hypothetical protein [Pseudonocardia endophytica]TCK21577.1 hypothetical protein EV378_5565 [Pseudonocardia endophytica]